MIETMTRSAVNAADDDPKVPEAGTASLSLAPPDQRTADADAVIERVLRAVREHLDLDVAFIGEVVGDEMRVFRYVDAAPNVEVIAPGQSDPLDESYCFHVLEGRIPQFLVDPSENAVAAGLAVTRKLPVGTHLSVPVRFSDGRVYGTFCCFAFDVRPELDPAELRVVQMVAELAAEYLEAVETAQQEDRAREALIGSVLSDPDGITMVFQPLIELQTMTVVGVEALARFPKGGHRPDWFFDEATKAGLGVEAELAAVRAALGSLDQIPEPIRLNINVSPDTLWHPDFFDLVSGVPGNRLVVEVTEHAAIEDYSDLRIASERLTQHGVCLAIDDVGMGFSGLNRILESAPEELKLDRAVIRGVDTNEVKQAMVEAFCDFGRRAGFAIVAEGIETAEELQALRELGVAVGQGYYLGRPGPLVDALRSRPS